MSLHQLLKHDSCRISGVKEVVNDNEIDTLRDKYSNENDQEKLKFLDELNDYVMSIQKKYENV